MSETTFDPKDMKAIIAEARHRGACALVHDGMTLPELSALLLSPQGREWATANDWPTARALETIPYADLMYCRIYPDLAGTADSLGHDWVLIGKGTKAIVKIHGTEALHHIVALDGAHVRVEASDHAVASIDLSASATAEIINEDHTAIISCHSKVK